MSHAAIVDAARNWIGTPYKHQASLHGVGCDCIGLVRGVWRELIGAEPEHLPAYSQNWVARDPGISLQRSIARHFRSISIVEARAGDILLFRIKPSAPIKHCAIQSAPDKIIHAYWGRGVTETHLVPWWQSRIAAAFSFPEF